MAKHKFAVGDQVIVADPSNSNVRPGRYTVVRVLPLAGQSRQYRVKSALDTFERTLDEELLHPLSEAAPVFPG